MKHAILTGLIFSALVLAEAALKKRCTDCAQPYKVHGCYNDKEDDRELPHLILSEQKIVPQDEWAAYMEDFTCRCAKLAKEQGFQYFGTQCYGMCWAGNEWSGKYGKSEMCVNGAREKCIVGQKENDKYCFGSQLTNYVHEIVDLTCDVDWRYISCFKDMRKNRAFGTLQLQGRTETRPKLAENGVIDWVNYDTYLPIFMCECARKAKEAGAKYFGVQFFGECFFVPTTDPSTPETYYRHGCSNGCKDECLKLLSGTSSKYATGQGGENAVFEITA